MRTIALMPMQGHVAKEKGFSLVELMVALLLALVITVSAVQIFIGSKQTFRMREQVALLSENGRFAIELIQRDIRMAGYAGCRTLSSLTPNVIAKNPPSFSFVSDAVTGFEGGTGWTNPTTITPVAGADVVTISRAGGGGVSLTGNMAAVNANVQIVANPYGFEANDVLLITDCETADLFRATNVSQGGGKVTIAHAMSTNIDNRLSKAYQDNAVVMSFESTTYFLGQNNDGTTSLYRVSFDSNTALELVPGIQDLQLEYAVDNNGDNVPDGYVDASGIVDWETVLGVRVGLLLYTDDNVTVEPQPFSFNGGEANSSGDLRMRSDFWATNSIRNRLN